MFGKDLFAHIQTKKLIDSTKWVSQCIFLVFKVIFYFINQNYGDVSHPDFVFLQLIFHILFANGSQSNETSVLENS